LLVNRKTVIENGMDIENVWYWKRCIFTTDGINISIIVGFIINVVYHYVIQFTFAVFHIFIIIKTTI